MVVGLLSNSSVEGLYFDGMLIQEVSHGSIVHDEMGDGSLQKCDRTPGKPLSLFMFLGREVESASKEAIASHHLMRRWESPTADNHSSLSVIMTLFLSGLQIYFY